MCRKRRGTGCTDGTTSGETKRHRQANCTRASYLFGFGFYAQAPTKSPEMPKLDADGAQATRKSIPTAGKLVSPQRHRCVIPQEIIHPVVTNCVLKLRPPTQVIRFISCDSVYVSTRCLVTNILAVVNVDVGAVRC